MKLRLKKKLEKQGKLPVTNLKKYKRKSLAIVLGLISLAIISVMGASYAVLSLVITGEEEIDVTLGTFDITLNEGEVINLSNAQPVSDGYGLSTSPYTFTISNTGTVDALYRLTLESDESVDPTTLIHKDDIKIAFKEGTSEWSSPIKLSNLNNGLFLASNKQLSAGSSIDWEIKLWMDIDAGNDAQGKIFKGKLKVEAVQQSEGYFVDTISPVITMNGESVINIKTGDTYTDEGILSIYDDTDTVTTDQVTKIIKECSIDGTCVDTDSVDTTSPNMYQIYYQYTDTSGNIGLAVRSVNVHLKDTTGPVITLNEGNLCYDAGAGYVEKGATALDDIDGDITKNVVVINSVSENILGVYTVKYIISDTTGNYSIATRTVEISEEPNAPVLSPDLIPVTYGPNGEVYKADVNSGWYNYCGQEWANAVTVSSSAKLTISSAAAGTEILMDDIEQMVVWIPRYNYDPTSIVNASQAIDVEFVNTDQDAHPAFCFGNSCQTDRSNTENIELSGIWIGKFEIANRVGEDENTSNVSYVVKPNLNSVNNSNVSTMYDKINDITISNGDVHMMKNTEWGLVAYFSQSKYGVCNSDGTCASIVANNAYYDSGTYDIITGCGPVMNGEIITDNKSTTACPDNSKWNTNIGQKASTTNNMYGIYDMAGGRYEYVMGNMNDSSGVFNSSSSGFSSALEKKYYDEYGYGTSQIDYSRGLEGDATKELNPNSASMSNWNSDSAYFVFLHIPWFIRGGSSAVSTSAGIFYLSGNTGVAFSHTSARLSLFVFS